MAYRASESEFSRFALISLLRRVGNVGKVKGRLRSLSTRRVTLVRDFIRNGNRFAWSTRIDRRICRFDFPLTARTSKIRPIPAPRRPLHVQKPRGSRVSSANRCSSASRIAFSEEGRTERTFAMRALMGKHKEPRRGGSHDKIKKEVKRRKWKKENRRETEGKRISGKVNDENRSRSAI